MGGFFKSLGRFLGGTPAKRENVSTLLPGQEPLRDQAINAAMNPGAGGAFGTTADYYRDLMSDNPADYQAFAAPAMRQFNEQTIPGLSEQFAGLGAGSLSSSGFRNAAVGAGADLSERLGALRANLRQQGAQGLMGIGQQGLKNYSQNMETQPGSEGFLANMAPLAGKALSAFGAPIAGAAGQMGANWLKNTFGSDSVGKQSGPY
jgi:hypothetical protein